MKAAIGTLLVATLAIAAPAYAAAPRQAATTTTPADKAIAKRIDKRISANATLRKFSIHTDVRNGVATLTGTVATEGDRQKAASLASVSGITRVDNQIAVDANAGMKGTAGRVVDKTKEETKKAGEKTKEAVSKTGELITDSWITTRVKSKFIDESLLKDSDIHVETNDHIVTLSGTVMSAAGRARAVEQAKEVEGVKRVVDRLTIGPKK